MEFFLNFEKPHISVKVFNFLEQNIKEDEARNNLMRLTKGLKLQYKEANACIETLLKALTMEDGAEDIPFVIKKNGDDDLGDESLNSVTNGADQANQSDPGEGTSKDALKAGMKKAERNITAPTNNQKQK